MASPVVEYFNGGLVTARHPSLLNAGELQRCDECVYREKDPAIFRAPGRTVYNTTALPAAIEGLMQFTYDNTYTDQLVARSGTTYFTSDYTVLDGSATFAETTTSGNVAGTLAGDFITFVATTGFPFTASAIGCSVTGVDHGAAALSNATIVSSVSGPDGSGHYSTIVLSVAATNSGTATFTVDGGVVLTLTTTSLTMLDGANVAQSFYLWDATNTPRVFSYRSRLNGKTPILWSRPMGLKPVEAAAPTITLNTADSSGWSNALQSTLPATATVGYYWFLLTEIYAPGGDVINAEKNPALAAYIVESAYTAQDPYSSDPTNSKGQPLTTRDVTTHAAVGLPTANLATSTITITFPTITNNGSDGRFATNWGIYMAGPTLDSSIIPSIATFRRLATPSINLTSYKLTDGVTTQGYLYPTSYIGVPSDAANALSNPNGLLGAPDGSTANASSQSGGSGTGWNGGGSYGFTFAATSGYSGLTVIGIELGVYSFSPGGRADYGLRAYKTSSGHRTSTFPVTVGSNPRWDVVGGPNSSLSVGWLYSDFDSNFRVEVVKSGTNGFQVWAADSIRVKVYYNGNKLNYNGPVYKVVTYSSQVNIIINDPSCLPPPIASTGDLFQGSFVLNDILNKSVLRYSLANSPEYFPAPYQLSPSTKKRDIITCIKTLGQILIVGYRDSIKRVNYLPRETDTDFQNGIAHDDVTSDHGIAGPLAAAKFDMPGAGIALFYVSSAGVFITDGITTRVANIDLNWKQTVNLTALSSCVVRVYPIEKWIVLYYSPAGTTHGKNTKALYFNYSIDKLKNGMLPCTGPITVSCGAAAATNYTGTPLLITANDQDNKVYVEDQGTQIPSTYTVLSTDGIHTATPTGVPIVKSRRMYFGGIERLSREERVYLLTDQVSASLPSSACTAVQGSNQLVILSGTFTTPLIGAYIEDKLLKPGTVITDISVDSTTLTLSQPAIGSGTITPSIDSGTLQLSVYGINVNEPIGLLESGYFSNSQGDLIVKHLDNTKQGLEFGITRLPITQHGGTADLVSTSLRLHHMTIMVTDAGTEQGRTTI